MNYQEAGEPDAPAMILIDGFAASNLVWSKVLLEIADAGFRVIAPDLLGYGYSDKPRELDYTIPRQAEMVVGLLQRLGIERVVVVGSSYGGAIAATIALDHPELVEKLVLVGAVTNNRPTRYLLMRLFGSPIIGDILSPLLVGSRSLLRIRMKRVYDRHAWVLDERRVDARHLPLRTRGAHRAVIRTVRRWDAQRISRDAHLLHVPTLLIWGDTDREVPLKDGERLQEEVPESRLIIFAPVMPQEGIGGVYSNIRLLPMIRTSNAKSQRSFGLLLSCVAISAQDSLHLSAKTRPTVVKAIAPDSGGTIRSSRRTVW